MGEWNEALNYLHFVARLKMQNVIWKLRFRGIFTTVNELEPTHCNTGRKKEQREREIYLINSISKSNLIARKFLFPITGLLCFAGHCCPVQKTSSQPITNLLDGRGKNVWSIAFFGFKCQLIEDRVVVEWLNSDSTQKEEKESQIPFLRSKFSHRSRQWSESRRAKNEYKIPQIYTQKKSLRWSIQWNPISARSNQFFNLQNKRANRSFFFRSLTPPPCQWCKKKANIHRRDTE